MPRRTTHWQLINSLRSAPFWLRIGSFALLLISLCLLLMSIAVGVHRLRLATLFVPAIAIVMCCSFLLATCSWLQFTKDHRRADKAFRNADLEFSSVFLNVLDGILLLDEMGCCLDANPAAAAFLRIPRHDLIGRKIRDMFLESVKFDQLWKLLLSNRYIRGQATLVARDGTLVIADLTAAANYLPGRHVFILCDATERVRTEERLRRSEERFQQMANNIQEIFWMLDTTTQELVYVNRAYHALTGHSVERVLQNPLSYRDVIHPEDRIRILSRLQELTPYGPFDEECRFIRADGEVRWAWAKGFPVADNGSTRWFVGTAQDITSRKLAEAQIARHLDLAEAARAEAEALRRATLALSQNLAMDSVLDTLLQCISELVPFDVATVLFVEDSTTLMVAREAPRIEPRRIGVTFRASENTFLEKVLFEQRAFLLRDVSNENEWRGIQPLVGIRSWLGVPLIAAGNVLGILSLGAHDPNTFANEHLRLAKSLAIAAAVAIRNARIHARAEIYAAELENNIRELRTVQPARKRREDDPNTQCGRS